MLSYSARRRAALTSRGWLPAVYTPCHRSCCSAGGYYLCGSNNEKGHEAHDWITNTMCDILFHRPDIMSESLGNELTKIFILSIGPEYTPTASDWIRLYLYWLALVILPTEPCETNGNWRMCYFPYVEEASYYIQLWDHKRRVVGTMLSSYIVLLIMVMTLMIITWNQRLLIVHDRND